MKLQKLLFLISSLFLYQHNHAQLMSKKEQLVVRDLHTTLVSTYQPKEYLLKGGWVVSMQPDMEIRVADIRISDGLIEEIGPDLEASGSQVINVSGKYLMPGLTDSHVHFFKNHQLTPTWLIISVLHGVTSVRDMAGEPGKLELREKLEQNQLFGPTIYQASPILNGKPFPYAAATVETVAQATATVSQQAAMGYDFIKVYNDLSLETLEAINEAAAVNKIPLGGHVPTAVSLPEALGLMNTIEHLTGYLKWKDAQVHLAAESADFSKTVETGVWNCPTLFQLEMNWDKSKVEDVFKNSEISSLLPDKLLDRWDRMLNEKSAEKTARVEAYGEQNMEIFQETTRQLYSAGAGLLVGTDAGNLPFLIPGYSFHKEIQVLHEAGIPQEELLKMMTVNAAEALGKTQEFGSLSLGSRADILVLDADPTTTLVSTDIFTGVMFKGIWLSRNDIEEIKKQLSQLFE